jgi:N-acetylglucosamine malate deacetylase 1
LEGQSEEVVLAVGAHPDDIEFMMAGTMVQLGRAGAQLNMWNVTDGSLGSTSESREATSSRRLAEALRSADLAGASLHPPIAEDMRLARTPELLGRALSVIRTVRPSVMLVPSPLDYHPDHEAASDLVVTAALQRALPAAFADPVTSPWNGPVTIYHALPFGLRGPMRGRVRAGQWVDIGEVMGLKREMIAAHASQAELLAETQGSSPLELMEAMAVRSGSDSGRSTFAEGWRRRLHIGLAPRDLDPMGEMLGPLCRTDPDYEAELAEGTSDE